MNLLSQKENLDFLLDQLINFLVLLQLLFLADFLLLNQIFPKQQPILQDAFSSPLCGSAALLKCIFSSMRF